MNAPAWVMDAFDGGYGGLLRRALRGGVSLSPPLHAAVLFRDGHVRMAQRRLGPRSRSAFARTLRARCDDIVLRQERGWSDVLGAAPARIARFDGRVMFALHTSAALHPSGYTSRTESLLAALAARGVDVSVALRPGYPWDRPGHAAHSRIDTLECNGRQDRLLGTRPSLSQPEGGYVADYATLLAAAARHARSTVIHAASNYLNGLAAAAAARRLGLASVYELRGLWHETRTVTQPAYRDSDHFRYVEAAEIAACHAVDRVVTLSAALRDWLVARGVPAARITVIGNAANRPPPVLAPQRDGLRAAIGIPAGHRVIGYFGALVAYEGVDRLLRALALLPGAHVSALIVGSGDEAAPLRRLARRLGVAHRVFFRGQIAPQQIPLHLAIMDVVALPRPDHPVTRTVPALKPFEAHAAGKPVLLSPALAAALGDTLRDGFRIVADSDAAWRDAFDDVAQGAQTVSTSTETPSWHDRAAALHAVYDEIAA